MQLSIRTSTPLESMFEESGIVHLVSNTLLLRAFSTTGMGRKHVCKICQKELSRSTTLRDHLRGVHSGDKPFACPVCLKRFARKSDLTTHQTTHGARRRFACGVPGSSHANCSARFLRKRDLKRHQRNAGLLPAGCDVSVLLDAATTARQSPDLNVINPEDPNISQGAISSNPVSGSPTNEQEQNSTAPSNSAPIETPSEIEWNLSTTVAHQVEDKVVEAALRSDFHDLLRQCSLFNNFTKAVHHMSSLVVGAKELRGNTEVFVIVGLALVDFQLCIERKYSHVGMFFGAAVMLLMMVRKLRSRCLN
jgi:hypothetical protein